MKNIDLAKKTIINALNKLPNFQNWKYYRDLVNGQIVLKGQYSAQRKDDKPNDIITITLYICPYYFEDFRIHVSDAPDFAYRIGSWLNYVKTRIGETMIKLNSIHANAMYERRDGITHILFNYHGFWIKKRLYKIMDRSFYANIRNKKIRNDLKNLDDVVIHFSSSTHRRIYLWFRNRVLGDATQPNYHADMTFLKNARGENLKIWLDNSSHKPW